MSGDDVGLETSELDAAMRLYLGARYDLWGGDARLEQGIVGGDWQDTKRVLDERLATMMAWEVDWNAQSLESAMRQLDQRLRDRMPEFGDATRRAMVNYFGSAWR